MNVEALGKQLGRHILCESGVSHKDGEDGGLRGDHPQGVCEEMVVGPELFTGSLPPVRHEQVDRLIDELHLSR